MKLKWMIASMVLAATVSRAAEPFFETMELFKANEGGFKVYHIPSLVVTAKGTVIAWCEARREPGDWSDNRFALRRSTDEGKTWDAPKIMAEVPGPKKKNPFSFRVKKTDPASVTYDNAVMIASRDGAVHMVFCIEYMQCFYVRSDDDGVTWSAPVEITGAFEKFRKDYDWKVLAAGPDHGIQLRNGRLIVPVWLSTATGGNAHRPSVTSTIYSDDLGKTWQAGEIAVPNTEEWVNPNETTAIELADGRVMLNVRNESKPNRRLVTISKDGSTGWSEPKFDDALVEPICMGSLVRYSTKKDSNKNRILFSHPDNLTRLDGKEVAGQKRDRKNVSVQLSYDEGKTWPVKRSIEPGWSAYNDVAVTKSGVILCFFGRGDKPDFAGDRLTLARFNLEWLTNGKDVPKKK